MYYFLHPERHVFVCTCFFLLLLIFWNQVCSLTSLGFFFVTLAQTPPYRCLARLSIFKSEFQITHLLVPCPVASWFDSGTSATIPSHTCPHTLQSPLGIFSLPSRTFCLLNGPHSLPSWCLCTPAVLVGPASLSEVELPPPCGLYGRLMTWLWLAVYRESWISTGVLPKSFISPLFVTDIPRFWMSWFACWIYEFVSKVILSKNYKYFLVEKCYVIWCNYFPLMNHIFIEEYCIDRRHIH